MCMHNVRVCHVHHKVHGSVKSSSSMASSPSSAEHFQSNATPMVFPRPFNRVEKQTRLSVPEVGEGVEGGIVLEGWGLQSDSHPYWSVSSLLRERFAFFSGHGNGDGRELIKESLGCFSLFVLLLGFGGKKCLLFFL